MNKRRKARLAAKRLNRGQDPTPRGSDLQPIDADFLEKLLTALSFVDGDSALTEPRGRVDGAGQSVR